MPNTGSKIQFGDANIEPISQPELAYGVLTPKRYSKGLGWANWNLDI